MDTIQCNQLPDLFESVGRLFVEKKEELCEMDAKLGDGDLGLTMSKGFGALPGLMREEEAFEPRETRASCSKRRACGCPRLCPPPWAF